MTLILIVATVAVLSILGVACRRARLDLEDQLCECLESPVPAAVGFGAGPAEVAPAGPVLIPVDGGRQPGGAPAAGGRRCHLRVVRAG
jgi:hypothetical protein